MTKIGYRLPDDIYEFIKGEVIALFVNYNIKCMPVSGFEIAIKLGIKLVPYSTLKRRKLIIMTHEPDGFYYEDNGEEYIYYNDIGISFERQNMTILHEVGHCVLDHTGINPIVEEAEANFFAKYAIAPPVLIDKISPNYPEDIQMYFDISYVAASNALSYYRLWQRFHHAYGRFTEYEERLLKLYDGAFENINEEGRLSYSL